jgi:hypothetical protein
VRSRTPTVVGSWRTWDGTGYSNCIMTWDRDLIRVPIQFNQ